MIVALVIYALVALLFAFSAGRILQEDGDTGADNPLLVLAMPLLWPLAVAGYLGALFQASRQDKPE